MMHSFFYKVWAKVAMLDASKDRGFFLRPAVVTLCRKEWPCAPAMGADGLAFPRLMSLI